jgi:hypothetical protein
MNDAPAPALAERLLEELRRELRPLGLRRRRRALHEARDHLLSAVEDELADGASPVVAEQRAVERFGDPDAIAERLCAARPARQGRLGQAVVGAAVIAGVLAFAPGPLSADLALRPASAATLPGPSEAQCAAGWNLAANAQWHTYAAHVGSVRAQVGAVVAMNPGTGVSVARGCGIKLWLARRPGHWQNAVAIFGGWQHGTVRYGTRWAPNTARSPRLLSTRTTVQSANARVRGDGTLDFVGAGIP